MKPVVLAVVLARAGSKGVPHKCMAPLNGRPVIEYTLQHALDSTCLSAICLTTDSSDATSVARRMGIEVVERPAELATDDAPVIAALRQAVAAYEHQHAGFRAEIIVMLYGNIPVRRPGVIDRAVQQLVSTRADSVRTVAPVGKLHPDWLHRVDGDRLSPYRANLVHRRQDLEPLYYHDGAVVAVTRAALETPPSGPDDYHAFLGRDRRALVQDATDAVDIDTPVDLHMAEALLRATEVSPHPRLTAAPDRPTSFTIGNRHVSRGSVFVIAEAGVNHNGDIDRATRLIHAAREAGADAVKFQCFSADALAARDAPACDYQRASGATSQHAMLKRLELPTNAWPRLHEAAADCGILFLATPFGAAELLLLLSLPVPAIKLASTDITNTPLLTAAARAGCPLLVSTGAAELAEVEHAVRTLRATKPDTPIALLHCVSRYPTPLADANLCAISTLRQHFGMPVGYSDHTMETDTGALAITAGALLLEKHLTLDRSDTGPDHTMSLTPQEMARYVASARRAATALGAGIVTCDPAQRETRQLARGSIVARRDLAAGTVLHADMLQVRRPATGIDPLHWSGVVGRRLTRTISANAVVQWSDME